MHNFQKKKFIIIYVSASNVLFSILIFSKYELIIKVKIYYIVFILKYKILLKNLYDDKK
jgi:hypothetical protein